jgi:hypothetical protein
MNITQHVFCPDEMPEKKMPDPAEVQMSWDEVFDSEIESLNSCIHPGEQHHIYL